MRGAIGIGVAAVFYYDQRIRHEAFDTKMMMDAAGMNADSELLAAEQAVAAMQGGEQSE